MINEYKAMRMHMRRLITINLISRAVSPRDVKFGGTTPFVVNKNGIFEG